MREPVSVTQTETLAVESCDFKQLGPYVAGAGKVKVTMRGTGDADLYVRRGSAPTVDDYDCRASGGDSDETCTVDGNGPVHVAVFGADAGDVAVDVQYLQADVRDPTCLDGEMPRSSVLVKADWRRSLQGELLPAFDTSGARMRSRLGRGDVGLRRRRGSAVRRRSTRSRCRRTASAIACPAPHHDEGARPLGFGSALVVAVAGYRFGADRPERESRRCPAMRNYKMCVVSSYVERDP